MMLPSKHTGPPRKTAYLIEPPRNLPHSPLVSDPILNSMPATLIRLTLLSLICLPAASLWAEDDAEWTLDAGYGGHLFPSAMIVSSTLKLDEEEEEDPTVLGDPFGMITATVTATADNQKVEVVIAAGDFLKESTFTGTLPEKGETYYISPVLRYVYKSLYENRQPTPDTITATVKLGGKNIGSKTEKVVVRSINDCLFSYPDEDDQRVDCSYLFAAYVNENHPVVQEILAEALEIEDDDGEKLTKAIAGYQLDTDRVKKQIEAVYRSIQDRGVKYSSITQASVASDSLGAQHVRLIGEAANQASANCVDGSVLFASVLRKMELDPYLVCVPGHMFMGVYLDAEHTEHLEIETTMVGASPFEDAVETASKTFTKAEEKFGGDDFDYQIIDIEDERQDGVIPLKDGK